MHGSATAAAYDAIMSLPDSEFRVLGVAAAIGGLLVMMLAGQPSVASLGWGCLGLLLFGVSRLMPRRKAGPAIVPSPVATPLEGNATAGSEAEDEPAALPGDLHAVLQRKVRVQRPVNPIVASSLLPPSRASRSPSTG
ncbi:MAG TPA: hypothetical protein VGU70_09085 [Methylobacterium sp.]|jgi:hypothetical protein|uniref:hypothetical protein n=1 Tax=Methylorubrum sp. B1-46 TaxID=2897334 RepID=UPI001E412B29|nr:hypothetical protein [Methylorubrum sp. B1-46]UGB26044.1 hypothetical protein LPC10_24805 [Methylorubrum sp. B1-46]HEV2542894.1 hypothetical protein [Methylobacterium sp.]